MGPRRVVPCLLLLLLMSGWLPEAASGLVIYRIGIPFSDAERDSLDRLGVAFRQIPWSASQVQSRLDIDSLKAGSLQPDFFDEDENLGASLLDRDGWVGVRVRNLNKLVGQVLLDGDPTTEFVWPAIVQESLGANANVTWDEQVTLDLGGRFRIREVRLRPSPASPGHILEGLAIGVSNRGPHVDVINYFPNFPVLAEVKENREPEVRVLLDPPVTTELVQVRILRQTAKEIGIAELEVYGGGFVGQAAYESEVIELEDLASWGEVRWSGRRDPGARVDIRTRSGTDPQPEVFWETRTEQQDSVKFLGGGGSLSMTEYKRQYDRLVDVLKPVEPRNRVTLDTENWSYWSSPYPFESPGVDIASPGPRKYFQIRADFTPTVDDGGKIDYVEFKASVPPAVRRLVGEIYPVETRVGEPTRFTYYIRPTIRAGDASFDGVEIATPSGVVSVDSLRLGGIDQPLSWTRRADGRGFEVRLPRRLEPTDSGALVEVVFSAAVLREVGTVFTGRIFDSAQPHEVRQQVLAGDASDEIDSQSLAVTTALSPSLLYAPRVEPNPFTPNGDGVNDEGVLSYKLLRVTSAVPVSIDIYELSGRRVKRLYEGESPLGEYAHRWDGRDDAGRQVPPGLYLYRIAVDVQSQPETHVGLVAVAY